MWAFPLLAQCQHLHPKPIAKKVAHVPPERLGEEEAGVAQQQGWSLGQILRQLPCARQSFQKRATSVCRHGYLRPASSATASNCSAWREIGFKSK